MSRGNHLKRRTTTYYWRRKVPLHLRHRIGTQELTLSLHTGNTGQALLFARQLSSACDQLFAMINENDKLTADDALRMARQWLRSILDQAELMYATAGPQSAERLAERVALGVNLDQELTTNLVANDHSAVESLAQTLLEHEGLDLPVGSPSVSILKRTLLRAGIEASRIIRARLEGRFDYVPNDLAFRQYDEEAPRTARPKAQGPSIGILIKKHIEWSERSFVWTPTTVHQNKATFRLFQDHIGEKRAADVRKAHISSFLDALATLPAKYGQLPAYRDQSLSEMTAIAQKLHPTAPKLIRKTINRHASAISGLFTWAKRQGEWEGENPVSGLINKQGIRRSTRRLWRTEELKRLFSSPPWRGCKSGHQRLESGTMIIRDGRFYAPLIALFSGARADEICKLATTDFRLDEGIWLIDITDTEFGRVKEEASKRTIPVHPELIRLGLIKHVETVKAAGGGHLWNDLSRGGVGNTFSYKFSKWFSRARHKAGVPDKNVVFHSFRHTVGQTLRGAGIPESTIADVLGHAHQTMSMRIYTTGAAIKVLNEAIGKISYDLDLSHLWIKPEDVHSELAATDQFFIQAKDAINRGERLTICYGPAGSGKTTLLMQTALRLSDVFQIPVYFLRTLPESPLATLSALEKINRRGYILIADTIDPLARDLHLFLSEKRLKNGFLILSERQNIWINRLQGRLSEYTKVSFSLGVILTAFVLI